MRYLLLSFLLLILSLSSASAQTNQSFGIGYFGETLTYPGLVLQYESEHFQSKKYSLCLNSAGGYYTHPRSHQAFFIEQQLGLRRSLGDHMFMEHSIGLGLMLPLLNVPVYSVDAEGNVQESSKLLNLDFMPSFSLGLGYDFNSTEERDAVWIRPKMFWQYPYNTLALPHLAMQIGFTHTFKTK